MKLSMWMIANRLHSMDPILNIDPDAKPVLKSARRAYATNCVLISQKGTDVICDGEGDLIRLKDISVFEASEIVQSVFDFYNDWYSDTIHLIASGEYQKAIDQSWTIFQNPMILCDGNSNVLGMSSRYSLGDVDEEWDYLLSYHYPSMKFLDFLKYQTPKHMFDHEGIKPLDFVSSKYRDGITYGLYYNDLFCGRITLLEKERPLNPGDYQLVETFAGLLKMQSPEMNASSDIHLHINIYPLLLEGKHVDRDKLAANLVFHGWEIMDSYQLYLLKLNHYDKEQANILAHMLRQQLPKCEVIYLEQKIIILNNYSKSSQNPKRMLTELSKTGHFVFSFSLPVTDINNVHLLMDQALYALKSGLQRQPDGIFHQFYLSAMNYIIESKDLNQCLFACHPDVITLWRDSIDTNDYLFETLKVYIENERSLVRTAQALYIHRNSVVYRIKKIEKRLQYSLEDTYTRDYISLSIRILELIYSKY